MKNTIICFLAVLLALGLVPSDANAQESGELRPKAVILNGFQQKEATAFSRSEQTASALETLLSQQGYVVKRFKAPYRNLPEVGRSLFNAKVVVYLGHGILRQGRLGDVTSTEVGGMHLGNYDLSPTELKREIRFAPGALVFLPSSCFAAGNCVEDSGKVARPVVEQRMYVYAKDFLDCGASMVLSSADPIAFLTEWHRSRDLGMAYSKAAYSGKETQTTIEGLKIRYREPQGAGLKPNSAMVIQIPG